MKVHLRHVRQIRMANGRRICISAIEGWFESNGWNFRQFCQEGIDEELIAATGDHYALQSIANAHAEKESQGG
jgi:hypothetical protein